MFFSLVLVSAFSLQLLISDAVVAQSSEAPQVCVRLPWQSKEKCKVKPARIFATTSAKGDVAAALESAHKEFEGALFEGRDKARKFGISPTTNWAKIDDRLEQAVMALGKLTDIYPTSVQPSRLASFASFYEFVKKCYPACEFNWRALVNK
jgi:hypothetical protein